MSSLVLNSSNGPKTFRTNLRKTNSYGSKGSELKKLLTITIGNVNLREAVRLPHGKDINEWFAIHIVDFYNVINKLYSTLGEFCTPATCPIMNAGSRYEYRWEDGITITEPIVVSAPEYVQNLLTWIGTQMDDETIFPLELGAPFPPNFEDSVKRIMTRMFAVYAHIYRSHFKKVVCLKEEAHLNTCFQHFVLFVSEYQLVDKEDLDPLKDLVEEILKP